MSAQVRGKDKQRNTAGATIAAVAAVGLLGATLTACGDKAAEDAVTNADEVVVTTTAAPVFQPLQVAPIEVDVTTEPVLDPGLSLEYTLQSSYGAPNQGAIIQVLVKNLNTMALPVDALAPAVLKIRTAGSTEYTQVELLDEDRSGVVSGLDLPLGSLAATNVLYAFNTTVYNMTDAELTIGNVTFRGNLNI